MTYTPHVIENFSGINLADDSLEIGSNGAIDVLNVDLDRLGRIRVRSGSAKKVTVSSRTPTGMTAFANAAGLQQVVLALTASGPAYTLAAYTPATGAIVGAATAVTAPGMTGVARVGTTTAQRLYVANGVDTVRRWDGAAWTAPAGLPIATYLAQTKSGRLVAARITGTSIDRVMFSDQGAPETMTEFEDVAPGDGSGINGIASWQDNVLVFKRDRFFVYYGEHTDADGFPVFDSRRVEGFGAVDGYVVSGDEGVYFFDGSSVWLTQGDIPRRISRKIDPWFAGAIQLGYQTDATSNITAGPAGSLTYNNGRLYLAVSATTDGGVLPVTFVYDPQIDEWTFYNIHAVAYTELRDNHGTGYVYWVGAGASTTANVYRLDSTQLTDDGADLTWAYTTGRYDLGSPDRKVIRETSVTGIGTAALTVVADGVNSTSSGTLTLGTAYITGGLLGPTEERARGAARGVQFNLTILGTGGGTEISRVTHRLRDKEAPK